MKLLKLLFTLNSWRKGRSKTLDFGALLTLIPVIDVTFFDSEVGAKILEGFYWLLALVPFFPAPTMAQAVSFLVTVIGGAVVALRAWNTTRAEPEVKAGGSE
jgi:hypothetical protein